VPVSTAAAMATRSPSATSPRPLASRMEKLIISSIPLARGTRIGRTPHTRESCRTTCVLGVAAMMGECGRYLETSRAVAPDCVEHKIAFTWRSAALSHVARAMASATVRLPPVRCRSSHLP